MANCEQHIKVFSWTCGFFVLFMGTLTGYVIANENRRVETLTAHEKENNAQFERLTEKMNENFLNVSKDLSLIKGKLGISP